MYEEIRQHEREEFGAAEGLERTCEVASGRVAGYMALVEVYL